MTGEKVMLLCLVALGGIGGFGFLGTSMDGAIAGGVASSAAAAAATPGATPLSAQAGLCGVCEDAADWVEEEVVDPVVDTGENLIEDTTGVGVDINRNGDDGGGFSLGDVFETGKDVLGGGANILRRGAGAIGSGFKDHFLTPLVNGLSGEGCSGFSPTCLLGQGLDAVVPDELIGPVGDFIFEKSGILAGWVSDALDRTGGLFDFASDTLDRFGLGGLTNFVDALEITLGLAGDKLDEYEELSDQWSGRCTMDHGVKTVPEQIPAPNRSGGTRYGTFNQANGRNPCFRQGSMRDAQAEYLSQLDADVLAFQEVDHENQRSGGKNTALEVIRKMHPAFNAFLDEDRFVEVGPGESCPTVTAEQACMQHMADGSVVYRTTDGSLVFGPASEKQNIGEASDLNFNALGKSPFGNATYIAEDHELLDSYSVNLAPPNFPEGSEPIWEMTNEELAARNAQVRAAAESWGAQESRAANVTTIKQPDGTVQTVFNVHLGGRDDGMEYKAAELGLLAELIRHEQALGHEVVLLGDCNVVADAGRDTDGATPEKRKQRQNEELLMDTFLANAGLVLAGGGEGTGVGTIDQIWVSEDQVVTQHGQFGTGGTSDHKKAIVVTTE
jgi:endonuclease/exonuclease/phosphatase family metal-dependent hydrolase